LTPQIIGALRPLDVDTGPYKRMFDGYREHTSMIRFAWSKKSITKKIRMLEKARDRKKAKRAYNFLMRTKGSAYRDFVERRETFDQDYPNAPEKKRKRPWRFLEEPGLENAVWPHLYWKRSMCESVIRVTDERRLARTGRKRARFWRRAEAIDAMIDAEGANSEGDSTSRSGNAESENDIGEDMVDLQDSFIDEGRQSSKRSFMTKVLSPIIDYGTDYELMQYIYDLSMWSDLGAKKNTGRNVPLRVAGLH